MMLMPWFEAYCTPTTSNPNISARLLENVLTANPAHRPIILPLLICLTALSFSLPSLTTGTFALRAYESPERILPPLEDERGEVSIR